MTKHHDEHVQAALAELMQAHSLSGASKLYRATLAEFLQPTDDVTRYRISANDDPSEAVVDVYDQGHMALAVHMGPGLAFSERTDSQWSTPDRITVEVQLQDVLDQGGLIYPVESVITDRVWYCTLPDGGVHIRKVE